MLKSFVAEMTATYFDAELTEATCAEMAAEMAPMLNLRVAVSAGNSTHPYPIVAVELASGDIAILPFAHHSVTTRVRATYDAVNESIAAADARRVLLAAAILVRA